MQCSAIVFLRRFISSEKEESRRQTALDKTVSLLGLNDQHTCRSQSDSAVLVCWLEEEAEHQEPGPQEEE